MGLESGDTTRWRCLYYDSQSATHNVDNGSFIRELTCDADMFNVYSARLIRRALAFKFLYGTIVFSSAWCEYMRVQASLHGLFSYSALTNGAPSFYNLFGWHFNNVGIVDTSEFSLGTSVDLFKCICDALRPFGSSAYDQFIDRSLGDLSDSCVLVGFVKDPFTFHVMCSGDKKDVVTESMKGRLCTRFNRLRQNLSAYALSQGFRWCI